MVCQPADLFRTGGATGQTHFQIRTKQVSRIAVDACPNGRPQTAHPGNGRHAQGQTGQKDPEPFQAATQIPQGKPGTERQGHGLNSRQGNIRTTVLPKGRGFKLAIGHAHDTVAAISYLIIMGDQHQSQVTGAANAEHKIDN